ncbi:MAG: Gfo/Idh/MocA family oxidoreductase [Chlorobia bacterium]|nr:Gfo/Idh/MocA family oxidoreductase [Fimbriimonadaceae bacterium]
MATRVAIFGPGGIGRYHLDHLHRRNVDIVAICDANDRNLEDAHARFPHAVATKDWTSVFATEPDLVAVCTPNKWHHDITIQAFEAGAHVICEKPMAMSLAEAQVMEATRAKAGKLGYINFSYRNNIAFRFARQLIRDGELGHVRRINVVYLQSFLGSPSNGFSWRNDIEIAGFGALGDLGVHMIDGVRFITGLEFEKVVGTKQTLMATKKDAEGQERSVTTDTNAAWLAHLTGGPIATMETTQVAPGYGNYFRIEISGDLGTIAVVSDKDKELQMSVGKTLSGYDTWTTDLPIHQVPSGFASRQKPDGPALIIDAINGIESDYPTFADGVAAQAVLEGINRSIESGTWTPT